MKRTTRLVAFLALLGLVAVIGSCATQPHPDGMDPPGFWLGLFHGLTIFFSLIGSIFTDYRIYAFPNSGGWYDFGFFVGVAMALGGGGAASR